MVCSFVGLCLIFPCCLEDLLSHFFSNLILICLGVVFFLLLVVKIHCTSLICECRSSIRFLKSSCIFSVRYFFFCLLPFLGTLITYILCYLRLFHSSLILFSLSFFFFPLCAFLFSFWRNSFFMSSSSLIFFFLSCFCCNVFCYY